MPSKVLSISAHREEIAALIEEGVRLYPFAQRIFLADGNALALETELQLDILKKLYLSFPHLKRVGIYCGPKDILQKSPEELTELRNQGLHIIYLGIQSGSAEVLKLVNLIRLRSGTLQIVYKIARQPEHFRMPHSLRMKFLSRRFLPVRSINSNWPVRRHRFAGYKYTLHRFRSGSTSLQA